jgi:hypothetical protein
MNQTWTEYRVESKKPRARTWAYVPFTGAAVTRDRERAEKVLARAEAESPGWRFRIVSREVSRTETAWTAGGPCTVLYHISSARNRASIEAEGLRLSDVDGKHIWLFTSLQAAEAHMHEPWAGGKLNDLWQVDARGFEMKLDPHKGWGDGTDGVVVTRPVPAGRVHRVRTARVLRKV